MRIARLVGWGAVSLGLAFAVQGAVVAAPSSPQATSATHTIPGVVQSLSCPSPSVCFAISQQDKNTRWGITRVSGKGTVVETSLISQKRNAVAISCPSLAGCEVFGFALSNGKPVIFSVNKAGFPGKVHAVHQSGASSLNTIACRPTRTDCVLVGGLANVVDIVTVKGSTHRSHHLTLPSPMVNGVLINAVACPSSSFCEAVGLLRTSSGNEGFVLPIHSGVPGKWAAVKSAKGGLTSVACPSTGHCYATAEGKKRDFIESITKGKLHASALVRTGVRLKGIGCTSAHSCDAVGTYLAPHAKVGKGVILAVHSGKPAKPQLSSATESYTAIGGYKGGFLAAGLGTHYTSVVTAG
jgi:hypothetical protein